MEALMKTSESTQTLIDILKGLTDELAAINEIQSAIARIASASDDRIVAVKVTMDQISTSLTNIVNHNKTVTFTETEE
tara:strand:+ start:87 stop:320 length:234 start_codon:yes stop_codon:yes gene_type:complete